MTNLASDANPIGVIGRLSANATVLGFPSSAGGGG